LWIRLIWGGGHDSIRPDLPAFVRYSADGFKQLLQRRCGRRQSSAEAAFQRIQKLTKRYNEQTGGKWRGMVGNHFVRQSLHEQT
jgi:hypothetical protein